MTSYSHVRSLVRISVCIAAVLAAPSLFGAAPERQQAQAQLLDRAELLCNNCFFGPSDYFYCFATDNKILIGYQRIPVINWQDKSKNYLTKVHKAWTVWAAPGETVPVSYDDKYIWVPRADGKKPVRLIQSYSRDVFAGNARCQNAVRANAH